MTLSLASPASIGYFAARMRPRRFGGIVLLVPFALFAVAAGCDALTDTSTTDTTALTGAPIIEIDPSVFLGNDVLCADVPGAMRSYVVTFYDYGPPVADPMDPTQPSLGPAPGYGIALPSSEPTPCSQRVALANGVIGHRYVAQVDGYEEDVSALTAACSQKPAYAQCIADVALAPLGNGLCATDADCVTPSKCKGKCTEKQLEVEIADGTCQPVKDGDHVKACVYEGCVAPRVNCVGKPRAVAPLGAGACMEDKDCLQLGCFGQCKKEPLQKLENGTCKTVLDAANQAVQAGVCIYTPVVGDRHMVKVGTADPVKPRWTTPENYPCGYHTQSAAQAYERVELGDCPGLDDSKPGASATGVRVIPSATLGQLACLVTDDGGTTGTITAFDVLPTQSGLAPQKNVACTSADGALFEQGVAGGKQYEFTVNAYENGQAAATLHATCFAAAHAGVIVLAKCDPLVPIAP